MGDSLLVDLEFTARLSCRQLVAWLLEGLCALELSVYQDGAQICPLTLRETRGHSSAQRGASWDSVTPLQQGAPCVGGTDVPLPARWRGMMMTLPSAHL